MPGGLRDVEQRFSADASGYIESLRQMIDSNRQFIDSVREIVQKTEEIKRSAGDDSGWRRMAVSLEETTAAVRRYNTMLDEAHAANARFNAGQVQTERLSRDARRALSDLADAHGMVGERVTRSQAEATRAHVEQMSLLDQMVTKLGVAKQAYADLGDASAPLRYTADSMRVLQQSLRDTWTDAQGTVRYIGDINRTIEEGTQVTALQATETRVRAVGDAWRAVADARRAVAAAEAGIPAAATAALFGRGGPGVVDAAMAAAAGGAGGGGGGGGWGALAAAVSGPPGGGGWDRGTAGAMWAPVGRFLGTWLPRAHYVLMAANELAATLGPATVAAGMGALVGMQGGEQAIPRLKAVFSTAESLGGSLGVTAGQYMGLKTPYLQQAQDLATGAAFEGVGAMTNILRAGAGSAFIQLGSNTVSMWSRMMANLTQEFQGGMGKQLGGLVSGGTGYLSQFGSIFGNLGHIFLAAAPNLPGVGGDYISLLQGATGGLARGMGGLGGALAPILAAEAGARVGTPLVGGAGALLGRAGGGLAGLGDLLGGAGMAGGLSGADAAAIAAMTGVDLAGARAGGLLGRAAGRAGVGVARAGGFLSSLTAADVGGLAAMAALIGGGLGYQTPYQQYAGGLQSQIGQEGFVQAVPGMIHAMNQFAAIQDLQGAQHPPMSGGGLNFWHSLTGSAKSIRDISSGHFAQGFSGAWDAAKLGMHGVLQMTGISGADPGNFQVAQQGLDSVAGSLVHVLGAGRQVQDQWKHLGGGALDTAQAYQVLTMAQLQVGNAFQTSGKHTGELTSQARTQIANLQAGYAPMMMNAGQFGSAVAAQTAAAGLQHSQISSVNQAYDTMMQLLTGTAAGASGLFGILGGTPTTYTRAGMKFAQTPAIAQMAKSLTSFTTPAGAAAWNTVVNQQSGLIPTLQAQLDQFRTMQTLGALGPGQTGAMSAFEISQLLPIARRSPAMLSMLSMAAQQFGGPAITPGASAGSMFRQLSQWAGGAGAGMGAGGFNRLMTLGIEKASSLGQDATQFVQTTRDQLGSSLGLGLTQYGSTLQQKFMSSIGGTGMAPAEGRYLNLLKQAGVPQAGATQMVKIAAQWAGATPAQMAASLAQVAKTYHATVKVDQPKIPPIKPPDVSGKIRYENQITRPSPQHGAGTIHYANQVPPPPHPVAYGTIIYNAVIAGGGSAVQAAVAAGNIGKTRGFQTGGLVPGSGSGDVVPTLLEPGEAVIPRRLVSLMAPFLAAHGIPGFGAPGISVSGGMAHFQSGGLVPPVHKHFIETITLHLAGFAVTLTDTIAAELSRGGAAKIARALADKVAQEIRYARDVAAQAKQGVNFAGMDTTQNTVTGYMRDYLHSVRSFTSDLKTLSAQGLNKDIIRQLVAAGPVVGDQLAKSILGGMRGTIAASAKAGLNLGGMDLTQGSVLQQMQGYSSSLTSFTGDLKGLEKAGLNKDLLRQIIAAGPVQGDMLAQSILGSGVGDVNKMWKQIGKQADLLGIAGAAAYPGGGVKGVNQLWAQLGAASKALGAQAGMSVYGGVLAPNLKSGSFTTNNVSITVSAGKGSGTIELTASQIRRLAEEIQAALLKKAKRDGKTGVLLPGHGV